MVRSRVTIPQLAKELGLSVGTVSGALNNKPSVAESTRERVQAAAARLGYLPNRSAAALRRGQTGILGLHLPDNTTDLQFYMNFAFGLSSIVAQSGYDVLLNHEGSRANPVAVVDAAVVVDWAIDLQLPTMLANAGIPVFAVDGVPSEDAPATGVISTDYHARTADIANCAFDSGAKRPLLLSSSSLAQAAWQEEIRQGLELTCGERGLPLAYADMRVGSTAGEVVAVLEQLIASEQPDFLVCTGERWAGIARSYLKLGTPESSVPWLASTSGDPITEVASEHITAIDPRPYEYGQHCGKLVTDFLNGQGAPNRSTWNSRISWAKHWDCAKQ